MEKKRLSTVRNLRNERLDGWDRMMTPRHDKVLKTSHLDARNLVINMSGIGEKKNYPSPQEMFSALWL